MIYFQSIIKTTGIAVALTCALLLSSCKKSTDLQPKNALPSTETFNTAQNVELAVIGIYGVAQADIFNGDQIINDEIRGEDMVPNGFNPNIYLNSAITTDSYVSSAWSKLYKVINQANTFIDGVHAALSKGILTPSAAASYEGEARFLRALAHHELVINFARPFMDNGGANPGVPYRTISVNTPDGLNAALLIGRGTVKDDYTQLLADLDYAEANLKDNKTHPISRASKGAAIALKTRIKLHMGDWQGVITEATKLGTSVNSSPYNSPIGSYQLTTTPEGPFLNNSGNTESIFSIENNNISNSGVNNALPALFGYTDGNGRGEYITSPNLYNAAFWVSSDSRRNTLQIQNTSDPSSKFVFNNKYRDLANLTDWTPIIRYAEVLLNAAEAYSRISSADPHALNLLNAVRNRAVAASDQYTSTSFTTATALTQAILNERRIEFAGEGLRWPDIHRLSKDQSFSTGAIPAKISYTDVKSDGSNYDIVNRPVSPTRVAAIPYTDHRFIWPIPQSETTTNLLLAKEQNPGY
ncbi:RagB/SusD family nutrient uptake outer membrane protein [Pedobacter sp. PAMC26386]|nr:RagB/SusD family nutrient uptake outer membrane protein [Pedobacter sp. PAMC26386]